MPWRKVLNTSILILIALLCLNGRQGRQQLSPNAGNGQDQDAVRAFCKQQGRARCDIKDVTYCDLLDSPGLYNQQIIRIRALLSIQRPFRLINDPARRCGTFEPQVSGKIAGESQFAGKDEVEREIIALLKSEKVDGDYLYYVTIIGTFAADVYPPEVIPHKISIIALEDAERTSFDAE